MLIVRGCNALQCSDSWILLRDRAAAPDNIMLHAMHLLQILITYFRFCLIYHLSKECALRRANTTPAGKTNGSLQNLSPSGNTLITFQYSILGLSSFGSSGGSSRVTSAPPKLTQVPDVTQQHEQQQQKQISHHSNVSNDVSRIRFS